jgi:ClpP class serine protease
VSRWLLQTEVADDFRRFCKTLGRPSTADLEQFTARTIAASGGAPRNLHVAGDVAEIRIEGILTPRLDLFAMLFGVGNTAYSDIQAALAHAAASPAVQRVEFVIDSPGGTVAGLFETLAALEAVGKPVSARASLAASAAYAIASKAGTIEAVTPASQFGSIGVLATFFVDDETVEIASTNAPNKRPDPRTSDGKAVIRRELDAIHELFVDAIARGRGKTKEAVSAEFGRGSVLVAGDALKAGMIDRIAGSATHGSSSARATADRPHAAAPRSFLLDLDEPVITTRDGHLGRFTV